MHDGCHLKAVSFPLASPSLTPFKAEVGASATPSSLFYDRFNPAHEVACQIMQAMQKT